jgi:glutamate 5-kinase
MGMRKAIDRGVCRGHLIKALHSELALANCSSDTRFVRKCCSKNRVIQLRQADIVFIVSGTVSAGWQKLKFLKAVISLCGQSRKSPIIK